MNRGLLSALFATQNMDSTAESSVHFRWHQLQEHVHALCRQHARPPDSVTIIGVTKYVDAELTSQLFQAGCKHLGEARPQQLWEKAAALQTLAPNWHLIGHLQRNKVAKTVPLVHAIHSLDSLRLAEAISTSALQINRVINCFLEVNISEENAKTGLPLSEVPTLIRQLISLQGVSIIGLMGMAADTSSQETVHRQFTRLRNLRDELRHTFATEQHPIDQLSMGMSQDYPIAIECGATHIRVGSTLFS